MVKAWQHRRLLTGKRSDDVVHTVHGRMALTPILIAAGNPQAAGPFDTLIARAGCLHTE